MTVIVPQKVTVIHPALVGTVFSRPDGPRAGSPDPAVVPARPPTVHGILFRSAINIRSTHVGWGVDRSGGPLPVTVDTCCC